LNVTGHFPGIQREPMRVGPLVRVDETPRPAGPAYAAGIHQVS
jgi:hypothetical protein